MGYRDFSSTEEMLQSYAEIRKRLYTAPVKPKPPPLLPEELLPVPDEKSLPVGKAELRAKIREIAAAHGVSYDSIIAHNTFAAVVAARREAMVAVAKMRPSWSLSEVARFFHRHHATVIEAFYRAGYIHGRPQLRNPVRVEQRRLSGERMQRWYAGEGPHPRAVNGKLMPEQVREIKALRGEPDHEVARAYGVRPLTIQHIWRGRTWKNVR